MFLITSVLFLLFYALLIFYYWHQWNQLAYYHSSGSMDKRFISVLVPARNEEKNIASLLKALSQQTYPKEFFEILVIDDFSTDRTAEVVRSFSLPNLLLIQPAADA